MPFNFGPAAPDEEFVYGACRPCYGGGETTVSEWVAFMQEHDITRVCCLLDEKLDLYADLLGQYREAFGPDRVCHAPVPDFELIDLDTLHGTVLPFLEAGVEADEKTVVHCSAGQGRTGHVLAVWLAPSRDIDLAEAVRTVDQMGRAPLESGASVAALADLLEG